MHEKIERILQNELFDLIPQAISVIDKDKNIKVANRAFESNFGEWKGKKLREISDKFDSIELNDNIEEAFRTREEGISQKSAYDIKGKLAHLIINLVPLKLKDADYLVCIVHDITEANQWQKEFNLLFERVPCYISVVDKELNVIRANEKFREAFGEGAGSFAFDALRRRRGDADNNPAAQTFNDGKEHIATQVGFTKNGEKNHYIVSSFPLSYDADGQINLVMEIGTDITEINELQEQLYQAHDFYADIIETSEDAIIATAKKGKVQIFNTAARDLFNWTSGRKPGIPKLKEFLPPEFYQEANDEGIIAKNKELTLKPGSGEEIPVRFNAFELRNKKQVLGKVAFIQDLREIKKLEEQKRAAEREAINHTFATLEKNIIKLTSDQNSNLERFEDVIDKCKEPEVKTGWRRLKQKINNTNTIVERFVKFAKGYKPVYSTIKVNEYTNELLDEYVDVAKDYFIDVFHSEEVSTDELLLDKFSFDTLIRILMTNAIDNVIDNKDIKGRINFKLKSEDGNLVLMCEDNGFSAEPHQLKEYFSDKPGGQAKVGMLTLEIIINLLDGEIDIDADREVGSVFAIKIPMK